MKPKLIFGTCLPRSGGSLASNLLSCHKNILVTTDLFHFFRFIMNKYSPITKYSNQFRLIHEICLRLKIRNKIVFNANKILKENRINSYKDILLAFALSIKKKNKNKNFIGEVANNEWRNIEIFLKMNKEFKAFQIIRDPRAILASWKKLTYSKGFKYLNIIFQWADAMNYCDRNYKKYPKRFLKIKFEDIHLNPKKNAEKFSKFIGVKMEKNMINEKKWPYLLKNKLIKVNFSSYSKKKTFGFSYSRTEAWKKNIKPWEVAIIQFLLKKYLKKLNYEFVKTSKKDLKIGLKNLQKDSLVKKNYLIFRRTGQGNCKFLKDPTLPQNWAASNIKSNLKKKFIHTKEYRDFLRESKLILKRFKTLKKKELSDF